MAFVTSARKISDRHVKVPYREDWEPLRGEGFAAYARRVSRPYGEAAASHFDPETQELHGTSPEPDPGGPRPGELRVLRRARARLRLDREGEARPQLTRAQEPRRGLDLRPRPVAARARADRGARRAGRRRPAPRPPRPRLRRGGLDARRPALRGPRAGDRRLAARDPSGRALALLEEVAAWIPELRALVVADALGTVGYFRAPGEQLGVHPPASGRRRRSVGTSRGTSSAATGPGSTAKRPRRAPGGAQNGAPPSPKAWLGAIRRG